MKTTFVVTVLLTLSSLSFADLVRPATTTVVCKKVPHANGLPMDTAMDQFIRASEGNPKSKEVKSVSVDKTDTTTSTVCLTLEKTEEK